MRPHKELLGQVVFCLRPNSHYSYNRPNSFLVDLVGEVSIGLIYVGVGTEGHWFRAGWPYNIKTFCQF